MKKRNPKDAVTYAIECIGGVHPTKDIFGVTRQAIEKWLETGRVPPERVPKLVSSVRAAGGSVSYHELRPDVYPREAFIPKA